MNTLVDISHKSSLRHYFILFQALGNKLMKKDLFRVSVCLPPNSLNMNDTEFTFIRLIKLNDEIPYIGMNPSFLRFVKHMRMDSLLDEI